MNKEKIKEIIKRGDTFQKSNYQDKDLAAKLTVDFENVKNANILPNDFNDKIPRMIIHGLENELTHNYTDMILAALKDYIRK